MALYVVYYLDDAFDWDIDVDPDDPPGRVSLSIQTSAGPDRQELSIFAQQAALVAVATAILARFGPQVIASRSDAVPGPHAGLEVEP